MPALKKTYPSTTLDPPPIVDLSRKEEREKRTPGAIAAFLKIMQHWKVSDGDACQLLDLSSNRFSEIKKNARGSRTLDQDRLTRISYLIGIFKALRILHSETLADRWVQLPNSNRIFAGEAPLIYMIRGGMPAMETVRRLLDARRGGL